MIVVAAAGAATLLGDSRENQLDGIRTPDESHGALPSTGS